MLWSAVEPVDFISGWHLEAISEHLEAVLRGDIHRLIINIPPRHCKSLLTAVFFPAWCWLHNPGLRFLFSSYAQTLSTRDSVKCRRIIKHPRYMEVFAYANQRYNRTVANVCAERGISENEMSMWMRNKRFDLQEDQRNKIRYDNNYSGYRIATSVDGALTGEGGDIIIIDDPHNVRETESDAKRTAVLDWFDSAMVTRLNDRRTGAFVIIMQRVHEADLTGHLLAKESGWEHLIIPARYETDGKKSVTSLGWEDPRREDGEIIWPERFPGTILDQIESDMTEYDIAGQHQQRPAPREGGMFKPDGRVEIYPVLPGKIVKMLRYWDKAATKAPTGIMGARKLDVQLSKGKFTAGVLMAQLDDGRFCVMDVVREKVDPTTRENLILQTAKLDGGETEVWVEQEPGSGGKESAEGTVSNLAGFIVKYERVTGEKEVRAEPFAVQVNAGNVCMLRGDWNRAFLREMRTFPRGRYKDQIDAAGGAFNKLCGRKRGGVWGRVG